MCGFIAQLVEHHTGVAEVMDSNPVEALIFGKFTAMIFPLFHILILEDQSHHQV